VSQTTLTVTTTPAGRRITILLGSGENLAKASELAEQIEAALRPRSPAQVVADSHTVTLTLPVPPGSTMSELQRTLALALPDAPELALLRSVLADTRGLVDTQSNLVRSTWRYTEHVDLTAALRLWQSLATPLDSAQSDPPQGVSLAGSERGSRTQHSPGNSGAAAWLDFAANSRVDYRFEETNADTSRGWQLRPGDSRELIVKTSQWNSENLRYAALAFAVVLAGMAVLAWRVA
jgi:hypothetical protein